MYSKKVSGLENIKTNKRIWYFDFMKNFTYSEMFSGPGGLSYGAKMAQIRGMKISPVWAMDYSNDACQTYRNNIHSDNVHCMSVQDIDIKTMPDFDGFGFGFPCNDFSTVGEHKGLSGKFGPLYKYGIDILDARRPKWFIAENVSGLVNANDGKAFKTILSEMEREYKLFPHLYNFDDYAVPQSRRRIIIVGIRSDLKAEFKIPAPTTPIDKISSRFAIETPPILPDAFNNETTRQSKQVIERLKFIPPGGNAWSPEIPQEYRLNVKGAKLSNIYKRLNPDKPSYTITGSGGGGTHVYHWSEPRALTNRERARLQTFPDSFVFSGSKESVRKQIGMAVPPIAAQCIFEAILKTFANHDYDSVPSNITKVKNEWCLSN